MTSLTHSSHHSLSAGRIDRLLFGVRCAVQVFFLLLALLTIMAATGCYSRPGPPEPLPDTFQGCEVSVDTSGREYVIVAKVGSPGYALEMDSTWEAYRGKHVFITVRRPDERFTYAQVVTELRLLTQVETRESIDVFARWAGRNEKDVEDEYHPAASHHVETTRGAAKK